MMVYIIGVNHEIQHSPIGANQELRLEFSKFIKDIIAKYNIVLCAEEFNEEALGFSHESESLLQRIALECDIEHRFCDPNSDERRKLGIPVLADKKREIKMALNLPIDCSLDIEKIRNTPISQQIKDKLKEFEEYCEANKDRLWRIREEYWLDRIRDNIQEQILFICGHDHVQRFFDLINGNGFQAEIIHEFWNENME